MLFSSRTSASLLHCCAARHTRRPLKAFGSSPMVDAMAYSVRRTPSSRARPVGWNNSFRYSLGLRYDPTRQWSLWLGTAYDETPGPSEIGRASCRERVERCAGVGCGGGEMD